MVVHELRYLSSNSFGSFLLICASSSWNTHVSCNQKTNRQTTINFPGGRVAIKIILVKPTKQRAYQAWTRLNVQMMGHLVDDNIDCKARPKWHAWHYKLTNLHVRLLHGSDRIVVSVRLRRVITGLMMIMVMMLVMMMMMMMIRWMLLPPPLTTCTGILDCLYPLPDLAPSSYAHATYFFLKQRSSSSSVTRIIYVFY